MQPFFLTTPLGGFEVVRRDNKRGYCKCREAMSDLAMTWDILSGRSGRSLLAKSPKKMEVSGISCRI